MLTEKAAMYSTLGISKEVFAFGTKIEEELKERFAKIDEIAEYNQLKVIHAMQASKVSEACLYGTTGYGYNDLGRDTLEQVYATCFGTEDALVRPQIACGTHALATALSGNLRPGDEILSPVGKPYDTLEEVIGIRDSVGSLKEFGITYSQVDLLPNGDFDFENIKKAINERTKLIEIQRSKGYATRPTLSVKRIGELISFIKSIKPDVICMVDNCYGEFVEEMERLGMIVDVSHLSDGGFADVARVSSAPFVASHSCARSLSGHTRCLTDAQLRILGDKGGVVGVNFCPRFLREGSLHTTIDDVVRHALHIRDKAGVEALALGSDFDGVPGTLEFEDYAGLPRLADALERHVGSAEIDKICSGNALRLMSEVWR